MKDLTIIIPVFNAAEDACQCINSLLLSDARGATIIVMDDGSSESTQRQLHAAMQLVENGRIYHHWRNRGYTRNVNMGLRITQTEFVCVLNSDTRVPRVWASKLVDVLKRYRHISAVGPLSNAASFQSVPHLLNKTGQFSANANFGLDPAERERVNDVLGHFLNGCLTEVPILNGFCTMFRTSAVRAAGYLDEDLFPQGYGEENDLCIRLTSLSGRLVVDPSTFIYHAKSASFGEERKRELSRAGGKVLSERYGESTMLAINEQLKTNKILSLARYIASRYFASPSAAQGMANRSEESEGRLDGVFDPSSLSSLSGPCSATVNENRLQVEAPASYVTGVQLVKSPQGGTTLNLPAGVTVSLDKRNLEWSFYVNVSALSHTMAVHLDESLLGGIAATNSYYADLQFGMLYIGLPTTQ